MAREHIIASIDIGSTMVRMVIGQINKETDSLQIIGAVEVEAHGINKGVVTNLDDATSTLSHCLEEAEKMIGLPIESVWLGISGGSIISQMSKGVVAIARSSGEIQEDDLLRALSAAEMVAAPPNYENIHTLVQSYNVDSQVGIKDPIGMTGIRLEAETTLIMALASQIKNATKCVYRAGVSIDDIILGPLGASEAALNAKQKELGTALIDVGGATTKLVVFEDGNFIHAAIIPIGSIHITSDIAIGLRSSIEVAEQVKLEYGTASAKPIQKREMIVLSEFDEAETESVSRKQVAEIIEARVEEIFERVDSELKKIKRSGRLPAGAVLIGGGAQLPGIIEAGKEYLKLPVSLGYPKEKITSVDKVNELAFSTALGLVYWGASSSESSRMSFIKMPGGMKKMMDKVPSIRNIIGFLRP
jgi:cell division protein FtsA